MTVNQFRRFTYLFTSENEVVSEIRKQLNSEEFQKKLKEIGIFSFEIYQKEQNYFLLIDVSTEMNSSALDKALTNLNIDFNSLFQKKSNTFNIEAFPLERIYELDQKHIYNAKEGQLKNQIGTKKRFVWTLLLEPDLIDEYKKIHSIGQAWPEITANMKTIGVKDMEIYLSGNQAILIMDTKPDFNFEIVGPQWQKLPREEEWQAYVSKFQRTNSESSIQEKWQDMRVL